MSADTWQDFIELQGTRNGFNLFSWQEGDLVPEEDDHHSEAIYQQFLEVPNGKELAQAYFAICSEELEDAFDPAVLLRALRRRNRAAMKDAYWEFLSMEDEYTQGSDVRAGDGWLSESSFPDDWRSEAWEVVYGTSGFSERRWREDLFLQEISFGHLSEERE